MGLLLSSCFGGIKAMSGRSSQSKGRRAEQEVSRLLQAQGFAVRPGASLGFGKEPDIVGLVGVHPEIKRHEKLEISAWMKQATADAARFGDGLPVVIFRCNRTPWRAVMEFEDWLKLYRKYADHDRCDS